MQAHQYRPDGGTRMWSGVRRRGVAALAMLAATLLLTVAGCSPEDGRSRGTLGSDIGNTALPIQMHGNRERNNPSFGTPDRGRAPADARGVAGWWTRR